MRHLQVDIMGREIYGTECRSKGRFQKRFSGFCPLRGYHVPKLVKKKQNWIYMLFRFWIRNIAKGTTDLRH